MNLIFISQLNLASYAINTALHILEASILGLNADSLDEFLVVFFNIFREMLVEYFKMGYIHCLTYPPPPNSC